MVPVRGSRAAVADIALLAEGYRYLAQAFRYPSAAELAAELDAAPARLRAVFVPLGQLVDDALAGEHLRLFAQNAPVSPYEGSYAQSDKGTLLGQLAALYELFGVRAKSDEHEPPDHVGAELEFCALLALKQALATYTGDDERAAVAGAARRVFVEDHLGRWLPELCRRLLDNTRHAFFGALASTARAWIDEDIRQSGFQVVPFDWRKRLPMAEPDAMACPGAIRDD